MRLVLYWRGETMESPPPPTLGQLLSRQSIIVRGSKLRPGGNERWAGRNAQEWSATGRNGGEIPECEDKTKGGSGSNNEGDLDDSKLFVELCFGMSHLCMGPNWPRGKRHPLTISLARVQDRTKQLVYTIIRVSGVDSMYLFLITCP